MTNRKRKAGIAAGSFIVAAAVAVAVIGAVKANDVDYRPGAQTLHDHWFPGYGNGGYDAQHYDIDMSFNPSGFTIDGTTTMTAKATQNLSRFSIDLDGLAVSSVKVDDKTAHYTREGHKLVITPADGIDQNSKFDVRITYQGSPHPLGKGPLSTGFLRTTDGAFTVTNTIASDTWFPNNDQPSDKATYRTQVTVPRGLSAISNGRMLKHENEATSSTFTWAENHPMASYLNTVDIGKWRIKSGRTPGGIPIYVAVDPKLDGTDKQHPDALSFVYDTTAQITDEWTKRFGKYPFDSTGAIVDFTNIDGKPAGYSEESQTRPVYGSILVPLVMAHELSHQWFGDSVTIKDFDDIWLNEGFATWAAFYWAGEHKQGPSAAAMARQTYKMFPASSKFWHHPLTPAPHNAGAPDPVNGAHIYNGGAMVLEFLREKVGDPVFFKILRSWASSHRYGNATTADFEKIAEKTSGKDLEPFFQQWVHGTSKPPLP